ncbi:histidine phosphatase family protein [Roseburia sp. 1XD42-34]|nr:histidine phosphatase family protein [Roseburia sp. 1XD42-34]RKI77918.1 histidine phosphatase family protein [Clostridium sp. 1xD42-85]
MTTICFIRHGQTNWNKQGKLQGKTDIPLNDTGREQAHACGKYLNADDYDILICSPLLRAKETAEIINQYLQLPLIEMNDFKERSFGDAEGLTMEERKCMYPSGHFPHQEERIDFNQRVMAGVAKVNQHYLQQRVLLVAHGAVINAILAEVSKGEIGSGKTSLMNGCISNIHLREQTWHIKNYNQVEHLQ